MSYFSKACHHFSVENECGDDTYTNHFANNV